MYRVDWCRVSRGRSISGVFLVALLLLPGASSADSASLLPATVGPAALATDAQCIADAQDDSLPKLALPTPAQQQCFIKPHAARLSAQSTLIVDIRPQQAFAQYRIPGSIRVPLYALGKKPFLKGRSILIVGAPPIALTSPSLCDDLQQWGLHDAKVLDRGIAAWQHSGGTLEGTQPSSQALLAITPSKLFGATGARDWLIVTPDSAVDTLQPLFPQAKVETLAGTREQTARIERWLAEKTDTAAKAILIATAHDNAAHQAAIEQLLRRFAEHDIYVLEGSVSAYRTFLDTRRALLARPAGSRIHDEKRCAG